MKHDGLNAVRRRRASVVFPEVDRPERPNMNAFSLGLAMLIETTGSCRVVMAGAGFFGKDLADKSILVPIIIDFYSGIKRSSHTAQAKPWAYTSRMQIIPSTESNIPHSALRTIRWFGPSSGRGRGRRSKKVLVLVA